MGITSERELSSSYGEAPREEINCSPQPWSIPQDKNSPRLPADALGAVGDERGESVAAKRLVGSGRRHNF